jgi:plasmid maintenance system antidote protein VapI
MNKPPKLPAPRAGDVKPWHDEELPTPLPQKRQAREYLNISGAAASQQLWAALHQLGENDDGTVRVSRSDIAKTLGVSDKLIHRWLSCPSNMTIETAGKLAAAMRADLSISAYPWEDNNIQLKVHSYAMARFADASPKQITSRAIRADDMKILDVCTDQNVFISYVLSPNTEASYKSTISPSGKARVEIKSHE